MLIYIAFFLAGLVALVLSGDWLVRGATAAALRLGVSRILASIVIVGFGTSIPEMLVAVNAVKTGAPGLAIGGLVGSNIANILLILGLPALFMTIQTTGRGLLRSVLVTAIATIAWLVITPIYGLNPLIGVAFITFLVAYLFSALVFPSPNMDELDEDGGGNTRWLAAIVFLILLVQIAILTLKYVETGSVTSEDSFGLLLVLAGFLLVLLIPGEEKMEDASGHPVNEGWMLITALICVGILGLPLGAHFAITGAKGIADALNWQTEFVGLTIIAIGTSLPELAAAIAATLRRENDMILGNIAGSNIFNLMGAGGIVAVMPFFTGRGTIHVPSLFLEYDHWILGGSFAVFLLYVLTRKSIGKLSGLFFLICYFAYLLGTYHFYYLGLGWSDLWT